MIKNLSPEEENVIKDIRNFFRLKKELNYTATKDIRNVLDEKKKRKQLKIEYLQILRIFLSMKKKIIMKVTVIEIKHYQLKNILIKFDSI